MLIADNEAVEEGQEIAVLESMKTEVPVTAASAGTITWLVIEGQTVSAGQVLAVLSSWSESVELLRSLFCRNFKDECLIVGRHSLVQQQLKAGPRGEIMNPLEISDTTLLVACF